MGGCQNASLTAGGARCWSYRQRGEAGGTWRCDTSKRYQGDTDLPKAPQEPLLMCRTPNVARDRQADLGGGVQLSCLTRDRPLNCREAEPAGKAARTQGSQHRGRVVHPERLLPAKPPSGLIPSDLTVRGAQIPFPRNRRLPRQRSTQQRRKALRRHQVRSEILLHRGDKPGL